MRALLQSNYLEEKVNSMNKEYIYDLVENFLKLLSDNNFDLLNQIYHLDYVVYEEILEELENCSLTGKNLRLANKRTAMHNKIYNRAIFDIDAMNDENQYSIECAIYSDHIITDFTLYGIIHYESENKIQFEYRGIRA